MRRWFIAIFSLLFFASVGLFAFSPIEASASSPSAPTELTDHSSLILNSDQEVGFDDEDYGHGAADSQIELPEQMQHSAVHMFATHLAPSPAAMPLPAVKAPTLDGLRRPPRA